MPVVARARCFVNDRPVISTARVTGQDRGMLGTIGISDLGPDQRRGRLLAGGRFCVSWSVPHNWVLTLHSVGACSGWRLTDQRSATATYQPARRLD